MTGSSEDDAIICATFHHKDHEGDSRGYELYRVKDRVLIGSAYIVREVKREGIRFECRPEHVPYDIPQKPKLLIGIDCPGLIAVYEIGRFYKPNFQNEDLLDNFLKKILECIACNYAEEKGKCLDEILVV